MAMKVEIKDNKFLNIFKTSLDSGQKHCRNDG
jgi:hypothetical protein